MPYILCNSQMFQFFHIFCVLYLVQKQYVEKTKNKIRRKELICGKCGKKTSGQFNMNRHVAKFHSKYSQWRCAATVNINYFMCDSFGQNCEYFSMKYIQK